MKKTMKRILAIMLVVVMTIGAAPLSGFVGFELPEFGGFKKLADSVSEFLDGFGTNAGAAENVSGYYTYAIDINGNVTITSVDKTVSGDITIPSTFAGYTVTSIGGSAFKDCDSLTCVTIPDSVISIGDYAFSGCDSLTSVTIPDNVTIGVGAFSGTGYYDDESNWENDILYIGKHLIEAKDTISSFYEIKDGTLTIADCAFDFCENLTNAKIPDSVTSIGNSAFYWCDNLTSITIGNSVMTIGDQAFEFCGNLTNITIPNSMIRIGNYAFYECSRLKNITIPDGITYIGNGVFVYCSSLASITIPNSVTSIGNSAFYGCSRLKNITIPDSVTSISNNAFKGCTNLEYVHIPREATCIYDGILADTSAYICSDTEDCYAKTYADENGIEFRVCDGSHSIPVDPDIPDTPDVPDTPDTPDVPEEPSDNKITGTMENLGMTYEYEYSDEFFENSSYEYNHDLATMSICLAISAMVEKGSYNGDEPEAAKKLMEEIGYGDNLTPCNYDTEPEQDSIACIIGSKNIPETDETVIAIAIRGAGYGNEWAGNFNLGDNITHKGFKKAKNKVMSYLCSFIEENKETFNGSVKYWVTGFSRSAATANLVAAELDEIAENHEVGFVEWWNDWETIADLNFEPSDVYAYTFETPMNTTSDDTGDKLYKNIFNIINRNDLVPYVAPSEWGYDRFGMDCKLPSAEKTDNYKDFKDRMSESYEKITNGLTYEEEFQYFEIYKDWEEWHSPILEMRENKSMHQSAFLDEFVGVLAYDIIGSSETYIDKYEAPVMELAEFLMGTKGYEWNFNFHDFLENLWESIKDKWLSLAFDLVTGSYLKGIVSSALSAACGNVDLSASDIYDVLDELDGIFEGLASNFDTTYTLMVNAVKTVPTTEKHEDGDGESRLMYTHHPSICLAWMDAIDGELVEVEFSDIKMLEDDVYSILAKFGIPSDIKKLEEKVDYLLNDSPYYLTWQERIVLEQYKQESQITRTYRKVIFNCPVNINVYDKSGALRASVVDDIVQYVPDGYISTYINPDGEKVFCLPNDGEYTFEITGTDSGMLNCSVVDFDADLRQNVTGSNYYNIPVENGTQIAGSLEVRTSEDLKSKSNFEFADGTDIPVSEVIDYTTEEKYTVTVESDGENGNVSGGGKYYRGEFAKVIAYNADGCDFLGWYVDGELISTENQYRFCVMEDIVLTAKYIEKSDEQKPEEPTEKPKEITVDIRTPSTTIINYGDSIWLHAEISGELPADAKLIWTPSNNNFEIVEVSADGLSCKITPKSSGTTTFTVSVIDANENVLSTDTQDMTAKAGLWQKIIAFFKKLFGATKTYPELFKILY